MQKGVFKMFPKKYFAAAAFLVSSMLMHNAISAPIFEIDANTGEITEWDVEPIR